MRQSIRQPYLYSSPGNTRVSTRYYGLFSEISICLPEVCTNLGINSILVMIWGYCPWWWNIILSTHNQINLCDRKCFLYFSVLRRRVWSWLSSGKLRRVAWWQCTDVSETVAASILRAVWWWRRQADYTQQHSRRQVSFVCYAYTCSINGVFALSQCLNFLARRNKEHVKLVYFPYFFFVSFIRISSQFTDLQLS
jgi:hypothetical protein